MSKVRLPTPASTAKLQQHPDPNFKDRRSGEIRRVGPVKPYEPPANKPQPEGIDKRLYRNK